jgi:predicted alpha/beta hydrolase family esterase
MKEKYIIIHGSFGSKDGNWFPWLKDKLSKLNKNVIVPQMPVGVGNQNYENWANVLNELNVDEDTIIIAHSIAPIFVCKYLITNEIKVKKLVFVCGFNNYLGINEEYDSVNESMYFDNLEDIKKYCDEIICYYSDNDPYVKYDVEKEFADTISTEQYCIHNGGHLNAESNYIEFKELLNHK